MTTAVLINGDFKADDGWRVQLDEGRYPPCPDCGETLREQTPAEIEAGLRDISPDAGAMEVRCGCGSLFVVVTIPGESEVSNWLRRKRYRSEHEMSLDVEP